MCGKRAISAFSSHRRRSDEHGSVNRRRNVSVFFARGFFSESLKWKSDASSGSDGGRPRGQDRSVLRLLLLQRTLALQRNCYANEANRRWEELIGSCALRIGLVGKIYYYINLSGGNKTHTFCLTEGRVIHRVAQWRCTISRDVTLQTKIKITSAEYSLPRGKLTPNFLIFNFKCNRIYRIITRLDMVILTWFCIASLG